MRRPKSPFRSPPKREGKYPAASRRELLLFAALILLPLIYLNARLIRMGFKPSEAGFNIELAQTSGVVYLDEDEAEE